MKKLLIIIAAGFSFGLQAQTADQYVIGSLGGSFTNANIDVNFTAGEAVIQTLSSAQVIITQGFHQPEMADSTNSLNEINTKGTIALYPNPTNAILNVRLEDFGQLAGEAELEIYNLNGQRVYSETIYSIGNGSIQLNVQGLESGHYQLRIRTTDGFVSRTRFVKS